jgi:hypothetical protein
LYGGATEEETVKKMAETYGYQIIYKYANDFGNHATHTDYKGLCSASEEQEFLRSDRVHNVSLVYRRK